MKFSEYKSENIDEIKKLFTKTFSDSEGESEGQLIGELAYNLISTTDKKNIHVFVATEGASIFGCIIFTRLRFENDFNAFLMSPVAVHTSYQGRGKGQGLIKFGLDSLRKLGVGLVLTYGDPNFYSRVGFGFVDEKSINAPLRLQYPEGWLGQSLTGDKIQPITGRSFCVEALNRPEYW